jgi:hypothetical protein
MSSCCRDQQDAAMQVVMKDPGGFLLEQPAWPFQQMVSAAACCCHQLPLCCSPVGDFALWFFSLCAAMLLQHRVLETCEMVWLHASGCACCARSSCCCCCCWAGHNQRLPHLHMRDFSSSCLVLRMVAAVVVFVLWHGGAWCNSLMPCWFAPAAAVFAFCGVCCLVGV